MTAQLALELGRGYEPPAITPLTELEALEALGLGEHAPTHLASSSSSLRRAMCGERDPLPVTLARWLPAHHRGYGLEVCPDCAAVLGAVIVRALP